MKMEAQMLLALINSKRGPIYESDALSPRGPTDRRAKANRSVKNT